jgi:hypothetical protein
MTPATRVSMMFVGIVLVGCRPSAQSAADTTAATSSTVPAVTSGPTDSVAGTGQSANTPAVGGARKTKSVSTTTTTAKSVTTTKRANDAAADNGIIGRDSVIRFPRRGLPTSSSTPR